MSDQLKMFEDKIYPKWTSSLLEAHARILALLENVKGWKEIEAPLLPKQYDSSLSVDHVFLSGKMLKELSPQTIAKTFGQLSKPLPTLGAIDLNGNCSIQSGFYPKIERESTLSDILEKKVENKYFLSEKALKGISLRKNPPPVSQQVITKE